MFTFLHRPPSLQSFFLVGEKKDEYHGSILHGFSPDVLARAWNLDEATAKKLVQSQKGAGIVKLEKKISPPAAAPNTWFGDFSFNLKESQPEILSKGGCANMVNCFKMPILKKIGLSAWLIKLKKVRGEGFSERRPLFGGCTFLFRLPRRGL